MRTELNDIYSLVDSNGRQPSPVSAVVALGTTVVAIPIFLVVLPVSILYQTGKFLAKSISRDPTMDLTPIDSGIVVENVIERPKRKYDVVLFGATGFTGRLGVRHLAKTYGVDGQRVSWAIAGRSKTKLEQIKKEIAQELGNEDLLNIDIILADTSDPTTLPALVRDTRAIASTVGPFEKYGSPLVEACAKYGTHYSDITGETGWVKHMMLAHSTTAQATGAKIVSLCGNDCIPWDLLTMKMEDALPDGESLERVVFVDDLRGDPSGGTIATTMMNVQGKSRGNPPTDTDPFLVLPDGTVSESEFRFVPSLIPRKFREPGRFLNNWMGFFLLSVVNQAVVQRSLALRGKSVNVVYEEYSRQASFSNALTSFLTLPLFLVLVTNPLTAYLVKRMIPAPGEGPTMDQMENKFYACISGYGYGTHGTKVESVFYNPRDIGYLDTARFVVESALCLAKDTLDNQNGGFWTPSTAVGEALVDRLEKTGSYIAVQRK